ncbi:unnamed protein product [Nesidiocoris tenuis]|uniref:Uncharacterized protein n=1 Tax=Nesidiocoris tenuis TaxID=355587 RepID=A0A6H5GYU9_9HEMI|nr:unnamed protein product [Nesidiocoris tenuis]
MGRHFPLPGRTDGHRFSRRLWKEQGAGSWRWCLHRRRRRQDSPVGRLERPDGCSSVRVKAQQIRSFTRGEQISKQYLPESSRDDAADHVHDRPSYCHDAEITPILPYRGGRDVRETLGRIRFQRGHRAVPDSSCVAASHQQSRTVAIPSKQSIFMPNTWDRANRVVKVAIDIKYVIRRQKTGVGRGLCCQKNTPSPRPMANAESGTSVGLQRCRHSTKRPGKEFVEV